MEAGPEEHIERLVEVFREVRRVMRADACLFVNYGDCYVSTGGFRDYGSSDNGTGRKFNSGERGSGYGLRPKNLLMMPFRLALALQADGWILRSCLPWVKRCLSGGTVVYARTQKGEMPTTIKDLVRLRPETVQLWNGEKWTRMKGCGRNPRPHVTYEIEFRSGERVGCTGEHRWPTQRGNVYARDIQIGDVVQTCRLPEPAEPARPMALDDAMVGWFVGLFIAEGCKDDRAIHIAGHVKEEERLAKLQAIATAYHAHCRVQRKPGNGCSINLHGPMLHGILDTYVSGEGAAHKHLNVRCWERSDTFLMALLEGYLSGDGCWDQQNERWRLGFTRNDNLAQDLRTLCGRLGVILRLRRCQHMLNGEKLAGYRGEIRFDVNRRQPPGGFTRKEQGEVVAIHRSRARQFWDIEVEDEPHLFALASGLLTHNSAMPESATDRPSSALEYVFLLAKSSTYFWDGDAVRRPHTESSVQRSAYSRPATNKGRPVGDERDDGGSMLASGLNGLPLVLSQGGRNLRNSDLYFDSLDLAIESAKAELAHLTHLREKGGLLLSEEGEPLALDVNTEATKEAHFAAFPTKLVAPLVQAGTSERGCCSDCLSPYVRVTESSYSPHWKGGHRGSKAQGSPDGMSDQSDMPRLQKQTQTLGWRKSCKCETEEVTPATVLDPFCGTGTVMKVSSKLGRRSIGIDLKESYLDISRNRNAQVSMLL